VLGYKHGVDSASFYIADREQLQGKRHVVFLKFPNFYAPDSLSLVKFH
jgi:hypothetical protein